MKKISVIAMIAVLLTYSNAIRAEEIKLHCSFDAMPEMTVFYRGGMGASDNTIQIGENAPVQLYIGSGFMTTSFNGNSYAIGSTGVDITSVESGARFFRRGGCSQDPTTDSTSLEPDLEKALLVGFYWSEVNICKAALETYFYLTDPPIFDEVLNVGPKNLNVFHSRSENTYVCSPRQGVAEFTWYNKQGDQMTSGSTRYSIIGSSLEVTTDLETTLFQMEE